MGMLRDRKKRFSQRRKKESFELLSDRDPPDKG
jgi:hypothetical protein